MKYLNLMFWLNHQQYPVPHGFTSANDEDVNLLRLGPLVIGWEVVEA